MVCNEKSVTQHKHVVACAGFPFCNSVSTDFQISGKMANFVQRMHCMQADTRTQIANDSALAAALAASPPLVTPESDDVTGTPVATTSNASSVSYAQLARLGYAAPTGPVVGQPGGEERGSGPPPGGASTRPTPQPFALSSSPPVASPMGAWGSGAPPGGASAAKPGNAAPKGAWGRKASAGRGTAASAGAAAGARGAVSTGDLHASEEDPEPVVRRNKKGYKVCCFQAQIKRSPENLTM